MNKGKLVGVIALARDGRSFVQSSSLLVCGVLKMERFRQFLASSGSPDFIVRKVYSDEVLGSLDVGGDPWAFDPDSLSIFLPIAVSKMYQPTGSFEYGFTDAEKVSYAIFSAKHSAN